MEYTEITIKEKKKLGEVRKLTIGSNKEYPEKTAKHH